MSDFMRLDALLSRGGKGTRNQVKRIISQGRVRVEGEIARDAGLRVGENARIEVDGVPLYRAKYHYYLLNKPAGVLTAARDPSRRTVMDVLPPEMRLHGVAPVGRLDKDTEGLLILTNHGELAHRLLSPRRGVEKVYRAEVEGALGAQDVEAFTRGIALKDFTAAPATLRVLKNTAPALAEVTICEGKYHQVRRMFGSLGKPARTLKRIAFAGLSVEDLPPGAARPLTGEEIARLHEAVGLSEENDHA